MTLYILIIVIAVFAVLELWSWLYSKRRRREAIRGGNKLDLSISEDEEREVLINEIMEGLEDE
jgi:hypothetical protein